MIQHVEINIPHRRIEQIGKDTAIAETLHRAWAITLRDTQPKHMLRLDETIVEAYDHSIYSALSKPYAYRIRYTFFSE